MVTPVIPDHTCAAYAPVVNDKPTDMAAIYTTMLQFKDMTE